MLTLIEKLLPDDKMEYVMECSHNLVSRPPAEDQKPSSLAALNPLLCLVDNDIDGDSSENEESGHREDHCQPIPVAPNVPIIPRPQVPHTSGTSRSASSGAYHTLASGTPHASLSSTLHPPPVTGSRPSSATGSHASSSGTSHAPSASSSLASSRVRPSVHLVCL